MWSGTVDRAAVLGAGFVTVVYVWFGCGVSMRAAHSAMGSVGR